VILLFWLCYMG